jgi:5-(carboxyamino)imidazole ribonucleotide mutase
MSQPLVAIAMGSESDLELMRPAAEALTELGVTSELRILSAHRTPDEMIAFGREAAGAGFKVIIAGAGGAAHLPGMLASVTTLPVIGVPRALGNLDGLDSLLSIVQMPKGVPVATVAIDGARNAGLLAARILATSDPDLQARVEKMQAEMSDAVRAGDARLRDS